MDINVYYDTIMGMWCVNFGSHKEYYSSSDAAYRAAYGI